MSKDQQAFPVGGYQIADGLMTYSFGPEKGMSLRDWFAGQALVGLISCAKGSDSPHSLSRLSYQVADAMLAARYGEDEQQ